MGESLPEMQGKTHQWRINAGVAARGENLRLIAAEWPRSYFFFILRRMGKNKASAPTLPRIRYMSCFDLTHAPVAPAARAAATEPVSMSTRPGPEGSGTVEIATRRCPHLRVPGSVGFAQAHPLTKTQAMEPSRQTWSSYSPPYPLGRWSWPR